MSPADYLFVLMSVREMVLIRHGLPPGAIGSDQCREAVVTGWGRHGGLCL